MEDSKYEQPPAAPVLGVFLGLCLVVGLLVTVGWNVVGGL